LLSIRKITLLGKWPTPLANGPLGQATGRPVGERSVFENAPCKLGWQRAKGLARACQGTVAAAAPGPDRSQLASHAGGEAIATNDRI
jgi:hypothetical protein